MASKVDELVPFQKTFCVIPEKADIQLFQMALHTSFRRYAWSWNFYECIKVLWLTIQHKLSAFLYKILRILKRRGYTEAF